MGKRIRGGKYAFFYKVRGFVGRKIISAILLVVLLILCYVVLYKIYAPRVNAFGCFDDCFNFVAGYFLSKGKTLYSEIFYNHQMLPAYISYGIQELFHPINIYELILRHRQFVFLFGMLSNILLIVRFGFVGFGFALLYEFSKFYIFGDRFLAEGLIVYPLVYMIGLVWHKLNKRPMYPFDYILIAIFAWFVAFMREPYIPLALLLFTIILWGKPNVLSKKISVAIFVLLVFLTVMRAPFKEYFFNVAAINFTTIFLQESRANNIFGIGVLSVFFYPVYLFFDGVWNIFRHYLLGLASLFLILTFYLGVFRKQVKLLFVALLILGFANFRVVTPGYVFYGSFHMLPWYGLFIMSILLMLEKFYSYRKKVALTFTSLLLVFLSYLTLSPSSYTRERVNPNDEFLTHFGHYLQVGEVVKKLSEPTDTLFVDGFDELIYWQADRISPYRYSWYTSFMPNIPKYSNARLEMFAKNPPDFYYGSCPKEKSPSRLHPSSAKHMYRQMYSGGKPTCLYINKTKIPKISKEQWKKAKDFVYELP